MTTPSIAEAERLRDEARRRLNTTLGTIQDRIDPRTFARNAARDVAEAGSTLATTGVDTVRRNPGIAAGMTAVVGLFLARDRITALFRRKSDTAHEVVAGTDEA